MKDREVMIVFSPCHLSPQDRIKAKERYDRAEQAIKIPIGIQMQYSCYVMTEGAADTFRNEFLMK